MLKNFKIRRNYFVNRKTEIAPEEIFLDKLSKSKEEKLGLSEKRKEVPFSKLSINGILFFFLIIILFFWIIVFKFQIIENEKFSALAQENKFIFSSIEANRGVIYDSFGNILAYNRASFSLILDKNDFPQKDYEQEKILSEISKITGEPIERLEEKIKNSQRKEEVVLVSEILDHEKLIILETKSKKWPGIKIKKSSIREYKDGPTFAHIIGYTSIVTPEELEENPEIYSSLDEVGRTGLEKYYEDFLRRNPGKIKIERDAFGQEIKREIVSLPKSGNSLILWLDAELQKKIEEELSKTMESVGAKKAVGVAINPKTGGILAMVSLPSFDNNLFSQKSDSQEINLILKDKNDPLLNRVIGGRYATGSTIKPLLAAAALQEKIISPDKVLTCPGKIIVPHKYNPEIIYHYDDWRVHGSVDMRKAIAESCNVYFYTIGGGYKEQEGLGPTRIKKYLELFGWGNKTDIDLPSEKDGFIPTKEWKKKIKKENWWDGDTYNLSIGQGDIGITPLEVAVSFGAIANNGTLYKPRLVKEIIDEDKNVIKKMEPEIIRKNFIDPENLKVVKEGMRRAVTGENAPHASSKILNDLPVAVAAKTGTAQTPYKNHYHNWITVFAPYEDPQIVMTLMIENVNEKMAVVIPTAKEILKWYFSK